MAIGYLQLSHCMTHLQNLLLHHYDLLIEFTGLFLSNVQRIGQDLGMSLSLLKLAALRYDRFLQCLVPFTSLFHTSYVLLNLQLEILYLRLLHLQLLAERLRLLPLHCQRSARPPQIVLLAPIADFRLSYPPHRFLSLISACSRSISAKCSSSCWGSSRNSRS